MIANFKHWAIVGFSILCLTVGLATIWLPIPTGVPLLSLGAFLIIANSRTGRRWVRRLRKKLDWLDYAISWVEERTGNTFSRVLKTTRPLMTRHRKKSQDPA
ncbi:hypothetical protein [Cohaesibacter celericrescens]|uniref:hypothetical protein n=1 Tax=Cohaesibacter celericrescens TaxID=2067669 RepID=UPI001AECAC43|nr:hypothetical protein [Cohaesibacter celericrescens]